MGIVVLDDDCAVLLEMRLGKDVKSTGSVNYFQKKTGPFSFFRDTAPTLVWFYRQPMLSANASRKVRLSAIESAPRVRTTRPYSIIANTGLNTESLMGSPIANRRQVLHRNRVVCAFGW